MNKQRQFPARSNDEWSAKKVFGKWLDRNLGHSSLSALTIHINTTRHYPDNKQISLAQWEDILLRAALLVERLGPKYLPLFERAEREIQNAKDRLQTMEKVRRLTSSISSNGSEGDLL